ncbi:hypothetical protein [Streptomyces sp. NPDC048521]
MSRATCDRLRGLSPQGTPDTGRRGQRGYGDQPSPRELEVVRLVLED